MKNSKNITTFVLLLNNSINFSPGGINTVHEWFYNIGVETPAPTGDRSKKFPEDVEDTANAASVALYIGSPNTSQRSTDVSERSDNDYVAVENPISRSVAV